MRKRLILGAVVAAALAAGPAAHAADPTITSEGTFDEVSAGTVVNDAYAAKGVHFGSPQAWGLPFNPACTGALATVTGGISGNSLAFGCRHDENDFEFNVALQFDYEQSSVSFVLRSPS